jgi:hypothetical protein
LDEIYQAYLNRVARLTLPATYQSQVQHIQPSPKFQPDSAGVKQAVSFPGYTIITPPWVEESKNSTFYTNLQECQQQLLAELEPGLLVPVPADSFHLTLADLIWDSAYRHANEENPEFEVQLRATIAQIFDQCQKTPIAGGNPIDWQPLGLIVMPRALAVCLVSKNETTYDRILQFRRAIYQNPSLMALGVEQQYGFTAHVTLGYFGHIPSELDRDRFCNTLSKLNDRWLDDDPQEGLSVHRAELRKFDDMTRYYREPDWSVLEF